MKRSMAAFFTLALCSLSFSAVLLAQAGSFAPAEVIGSQDNPDGFRYRLPVNRGPELQGPLPSNRWWSALLVRDEVKVISPFPLTYSLANLEYPAEGEGFGLAVSYKGIGRPLLSDEPTHDLSGNRVRVVSTDVQPQFLIWNSAMARATMKTKLQSFGDWHIVTKTADAAGSGFTTTMAAGSPYTSFLFSRGQPKIRLNSYAAKMTFTDRDGQAILGDGDSYSGDAVYVTLLHPLTQQPSYWGFFAGPQTEWIRSGEYLSVNLGEGSDDLQSAVLPNLGSRELFYQHAYQRIIGTEASFQYDEATATVHTRFSFRSEALRPGFPSEILTTQFPHQYKHLAPEKGREMLGTYPTQRGLMQLWRGHSFATVLRNGGILPSFTAPAPSPSYDRASHKQWLAAEAPLATSFGIDTYGTGKALLRAGQSLALAAALDEPQIKEQIRAALANEFADWFTYSPGTEPLFWGDQKPYKFFSRYRPEDGHWGHLVGWRASYGAQALNDGPLHYGYWIYAAALLGRHDPVFLQNYGREVEELIRHIASPSRQDPIYPYLRPFDPYTGRSYASGYYDQGYYSGNDLESTSEVLNAWQAIFQWGQITGQKTYRDLGLYLYWTERSAVEQYWHNIDGDNLHPKYEMPLVPLLREGGYEFQTHWGAREIEELVGIQYIPLTVGTLHSAFHKEWQNKLWRWTSGINLAASGTTFNTWHGTMLQLQALSDPLGAVSRFKYGEIAVQQGQDYNPLQEHETWSLIYSFIHNLAQLGRPDNSFYADSPSYGVFAQAEAYHLVAFNPSPDEALTVRFYDRAGIEVAVLANIPPRQSAQMTLPR